jgi:hypothetical protein
MSEVNPESIVVTNYFGGCPTCGRAEWLNDGRRHWLVCHVHRLRQMICHEPLYRLPHEDEELAARNRDMLSAYEDAEFLPAGTWSTDPEIRRAEIEDRRRIREAEEDRRVRCHQFVAKLSVTLMPLAAKLTEEEQVAIEALFRRLTATSKGVAVSPGDDDIHF